MGDGERIDVVQPHRHSATLGTLTNATTADAGAAVEAAMTAKADWAATPFDERAAVFLRAADLLAGPWRETIAAATMLGQSKTAYQAEIDAPCELVDFWRFNVAFARGILAQQPISSPGVWNRSDDRPLDGFVERKRHMGALYTELLQGTPGVQLPLARTAFADNIYWVFALVLDDALPVDAKGMMKKLGDAGIGTRPFFWPMHEQPVFRKMGLYAGESLPVAERIARRGFYIPSGLAMTDDEIRTCAATVQHVLKEFT